MKIRSSKISLLFQVVMGVVLTGFTANAIYKYMNGVGVEKNSAGSYSHPLADLAIIAMIVLFIAVFYIARWFKRRDERDFLKKYKK